MNDSETMPRSVPKTSFSHLQARALPVKPCLLQQLLSAVLKIGELAHGKAHGMAHGQKIVQTTNCASLAVIDLDLDLGFLQKLVAAKRIRLKLSRHSF